MRNEKFKMENLKLAGGFTLIELIVVMAILAILAVVVLATLDPLGQFQRANDARRKSDLEQTQRALETYYHDYGAYPNSITWGGSWSPYMTTVPKDPSNAKQYIYVSLLSGQAYRIYVNLDRGTKDSQACSSYCTNAAGLSCIKSTADTCNYGVSSPNTSP